MISTKVVILAALSATLPMLAAQAQTTKFNIKQIVVAGDDNVQAAALNDSGVIVGTVYAGITGAPSGFSMAGNTVTTLPSPNVQGAGFNPRAIDATGNIYGWARAAAGSVGDALTYYLSNSGTYNAAYQSTVLAPSNIEADTVPVAMGLNAKGEVFFNTIYSLSGPVGTNYGKPPNYKSVPAIDRFTEIESLNNSGTIAVEGFSFSGVYSLYFGKGKTFTQVLPTGSINTRGGLLNNTGAIAGSYLDTSRAPHGFVYAGGNYTTFNMPEAASAISVTGFNDLGRVVGSYSSAADGKQHAFLYNGTTVASFGGFDSLDTVKLAINNKGAIIVADQINAHTLKFLSYRVACTGSGC